MNAKQFSRALSDLARVPSRVAPAVAKGIKRQIEKDFDAGRDPYGKAWQPLAKSTIARGRHPPPLTDTRKGRRSIRVFASGGAGVTITVGKDYMRRHQEGDGPPIRRILPVGVLPKTWRAVWEKEIDRDVKAKLGK